MRKSVAMVVALVALLTGLLTGCGPAATAARVGDAEITETRLTQLAEAAAAVDGTSPVTIRSTILSLAMRGHVAKEVLAAHPEITLDPAQRESALSQFPAAVLNDANLRGLVEGMINYEVLKNTMGPAPLADAAAAIPVTVNPRYGHWDPATQVVGMANESLSRLWQS